MERCPNCGAPARPNANFCTTCGVRLPDDLAPTQPPAADAAPATDNGWPSVDEEAGAPPVANPENADAGAPADDGEAAAEPAVVVAAASETVGLADASAETWSSAAWPAWTAPAEAPGAAESPTPADDGADQPTTNIEVHAPAAPTPPVERALALLDELRALLPAAVAVSSEPSATGAADALAAALAADDDDRAALRDAMERARERPKDIDTVLDLAGRVDAVIALLDAYDRLRAAAETTVAELRAGKA